MKLFTKYLKELEFAHNYIERSNFNLQKNFVLNKLGDFCNIDLLERNLNIFEPDIDGNFYVAHFTKNLKGILNEQTIFTSQGNLVDAVYCIPIRKSKEKFRLHNYSKNLFKHLPEEERNKIDLLLFEFRFDKFKNQNVLGVNYLKLGPLFWEITNESVNQLPKDFNNIIKNEYLEIESSLKELQSSERKNPSFIDKISKISKDHPVIASVYFEAITLILMYCSKDKETTKLSLVGETNNTLYIDFVHDLSKQTKKDFASNIFSPSFNRLNNVFKEYVNQGRIEIDNNSFYNLLIDIINEILEKYLFFQDFKIGNYNTSLLGQLAWLYFYKNGDNFEETKKHIIRQFISRVRDYRNDIQTNIIINSCTPKGEIGICPDIDTTLFKVYQADYNLDELTLVQKNLINIKGIKSKIQ